MASLPTLILGDLALPAISPSCFDRMSAHKTYATLATALSLLSITAPSATKAQDVFDTQKLKIKLEYYGNRIINPSPACSLWFFRADGGGWKTVSGIAGTGWRELTKDDSIERLAICINTAKFTEAGEIIMGVFTTFGLDEAPRSYTDMNYSLPHMCAYKGRGSFFRTWPRNYGPSYMACSSAFKGNIGFLASYTEKTEWLDVNKVMAAASLPEIASKLKDQYVAYLENQIGAMSFRDWATQFGPTASPSTLERVMKFAIESDELALFSKYASSALTLQALEQGKLYWMEQYRKGWDKVMANPSDVAMLKKYASLVPLKDGIMELKTADFDMLAPRAHKMLNEHYAQEEAKAKKAAKDLEMQLAGEKAEAAKAEEKRQKRLAKFRKSLRIGMDTNCGKVVELKASVVKVYFPVEGIGTEHWVDVGDMDEASQACEKIQKLAQAYAPKKEETAACQSTNYTFTNPYEYSDRTSLDCGSFKSNVREMRENGWTIKNMTSVHKPKELGDMSDYNVFHFTYTRMK